MSLPFPLHKRHRADTKYNWIIRRGMNIDEEDFPYIYDIYIHETNCDLCGKPFLTSHDRHLDHDHETREVRNIVCHNCNQHKEDRASNTNTGENHICKCKRKDTKNGYRYVFQIFRDGKNIVTKTSVDLDKLIKFRNEFIKAHPEIHS
jgi:hypothetical protein